jgi:hypothetical protein
LVTTGTRIVLELSEKPKSKPKIWNNVKTTIENAGGTYISEPTENPPYIITAVLPDENSAQKILKILRSSEGVKQADIDQMRFAL